MYLKMCFIKTIKFVGQAIPEEIAYKEFYNILETYIKSFQDIFHEVNSTKIYFNISLKDLGQGYCTLILDQSKKTRYNNMS